MLKYKVNPSVLYAFPKSKSKNAVKDKLMYMVIAQREEKAITDDINTATSIKILNDYGEERWYKLTHFDIAQFELTPNVNTQITTFEQWYVTFVEVIIKSGYLHKIDFDFAMLYFKENKTPLVAAEEFIIEFGNPTEKIEFINLINKR